MLRNVVAIVVGYAAIVAATFLLLTLLWTALGPDGAFEPGTYRTSTAWALGSLLLGFLLCHAPAQVECYELGTALQAATAELRKDDAAQATCAA